MFVRILDLPKVCQGSLWVVLASILQLWVTLSLSMMWAMVWGLEPGKADGSICALRLVTDLTCGSLLA